MTTGSDGANGGMAFQFGGEGRTSHPALAALSLAAEFSADGSIHYIRMDWRHTDNSPEPARPCTASRRTWWSGPRRTLVREFLPIAARSDSRIPKRRRGAPESFGARSAGRSPTLWTYPGVNSFRAGRLDELSLHPRVHPVAMAADAMGDCSRRGDILLDPFMGSGATILAAERVSRCGYAIEIDPVTSKSLSDARKLSLARCCSGKDFRNLDQVSRARRHSCRKYCPTEAVGLARGRDHCETSAALGKGVTPRRWAYIKTFAFARPAFAA